MSRRVGGAVPVLLDPKILWNADTLYVTPALSPKLAGAANGRKTDSPTMSLFLLRRGLAALLLVFAVTSGALLLAQLAPGDYASAVGTDPRSRWPRSGIAWASIGRSLEQYTRLAETHADARPRRIVPVPAARPRSWCASGAANTALLAIAALVVATLLGIPSGIVTGSRARVAGARILRGAVAGAPLGAAAHQLAGAADDRGAHRLAAGLRHGRAEPFRRADAGARAAVRRDARAAAVAVDRRRAQPPVRGWRRARAAFPRRASSGGTPGGSRSGRSSPSTA